MVSRFLHSKSKTITFAALLIASFSLLSRVLGLLRNNLLGHLFSRAQADIYLAAFRIPDLVYGILITGGIAAAFLPVFARHFRDSKEKAQELASNTLTIFGVGLIVLSLLLYLFSPWLVRLVVPGFDAIQQAQTVALMKIMFLSPIILGLSAIFSAVLHYFNLFFAYALAPVFYNLGIIFGILFLAPNMGLTGLAWGVVLGAFFHLFIQLPAVIKQGFSPKFSFKITQGLKKIFRLMIPRTISSAAYHINLIVITAIASTLPAGSIRVFAFSNDLYGVPLSLIGVSFGLAVFPVLSRHFAQKAHSKFFDNFSSTFSQIIFLALPITFLTFLFRAQLVRLFYGTKFLGDGFFAWQDTRLIAASLGIFAFSVFAGCLIPFLARTFFAVHNTKTPLKIALVSIGLNIVFSFLFVNLLQTKNSFQSIVATLLRVGDISDISILGLALAITVSSLIQMFLLVIFIKKKIKFIFFNKLLPSFLKIILASLLIAPLAWASLYISASWFNTQTVVGIFCQLTFSALISLVAYLTIAFLLKMNEPKMIYSSITRQFKK